MKRSKEVDDTVVEIQLPDGTTTGKMPLKEMERRVKQATESIGHNSGVSGERLRSFIQRIERLEEDKAAISEDLKEVYAEAKGVGFDTKIVRLIMREKKMDIKKRRERDELLSLYKSAIGMDD